MTFFSLISALICLVCFLLFLKHLSHLVLNLWSNKEVFSNFSYPVTIVICIAKNSPVLNKVIRQVLAQNHEHFELMLLIQNDLEEIKSSLKQVEHQKITIVDAKIIEFGQKGKLIDLAVKYARHEVIITLDDDTFPKDSQWLQHSVAPFESESIKLSLGVSPIVPHLHRSSLQAFDNFYVFLSMSLAAMSQKAYMGLGRNLAFRKSLWLAYRKQESNTKGYGDDDLLVQFADKSEVALNESSVAYTMPYSSLISFSKAKIRHHAIGYQYNKASKDGSSRILLTKIAFWIVFVFWFQNFDTHAIGIFLALALVILEHMCYSALSFRKRYRYPYLLGFLWCVVHPFYIALIALIALIYKPKW
ncbi:MAG: glycosyltransferase [Chitinophagales bacterium]|jgi:hypothetical protein|nr:glycosyltransferase [Chitinophagales bacterium]